MLKGGNMLLLVVVIVMALFSSWVIAGYLPTRNIETPDYRVVETTSDYQIRRYASYIVAETHQKGSQKESLSGGFRELFRYITGANIAHSKIAMTAPVLQSGEAGGEKISMSAPVIKQGEGGASSIAFVMPKGSRLEELPRPKSAGVRLRVVPPGSFAVTAFSGFPTEAKLKAKIEKLLAALVRDGRVMRAAPQIALYNPPWTPPFMRRNEVMVEIDAEEEPPRIR
jgi:DNA gyrase inhibitor GyrI